MRRFREDSGNAGMVARELPSDEVLASWQHVEQRALDLRAAGMPGTLQELRVRAYLDLLQERDSRDQLQDAASPPARRAASGSRRGQRPGPAPAGGDGATRRRPGGPTAPAARRPGERARRTRGTAPGPGAPARNGPAAPLPSGPGSRAEPGRAGHPHHPLGHPPGHSETPGEADGFGLLDGDDARDLAAAAARHPATRWCVTALNPDGTAAAHGCLTGRHPPPAPHPPAPPGSLNLTMIPVTRGPCDHAHAEAGYHPSRKLAHLIRARSATCTAPGCRRPAARCDLDHTHPWDQGGLTCECDLAPLCRRHHRCKQAEGWHLEQPEPGVLIWRDPVRPQLRHHAHRLSQVTPDPARPSVRFLLWSNASAVPDFGLS